MSCLSDEIDNKEGIEDDFSPKIVLKKDGMNSFEMYKQKKNKSSLLN
jgi:hypothetical protein